MWQYHSQPRFVSLARHTDVQEVLVAAKQPLRSHDVRAFTVEHLAGRYQPSMYVNDIATYCAAALRTWAKLRSGATPTEALYAGDDGDCSSVVNTHLQDSLEAYTETCIFVVPPIPVDAPRIVAEHVIVHNMLVRLAAARGLPAVEGVARFPERALAVPATTSNAAMQLRALLGRIAAAAAGEARIARAHAEFAEADKKKKNAGDDGDNNGSSEVPSVGNASDEAAGNDTVMHVAATAIACGEWAVALELLPPPRLARGVEAALDFARDVGYTGRAEKTTASGSKHRKLAAAQPVVCQGDDLLRGKLIDVLLRDMGQCIWANTLACAAWTYPSVACDPPPTPPPTVTMLRTRCYWLDALLTAAAHVAVRQRSRVAAMQLGEDLYGASVTAAHAVARACASWNRDQVKLRAAYGRTVASTPLVGPDLRAVSLLAQVARLKPAQGWPLVKTFVAEVVPLSAEAAAWSRWDAQVSQTGTVDEKEFDGPAPEGALVTAPRPGFTAALPELPAKTREHLLHLAADAGAWTDAVAILQHGYPRYAAAFEQFRDRIRTSAGRGDDDGKTAAPASSTAALAADDIPAGRTSNLYIHALGKAEQWQRAATWASFVFTRRHHNHLTPRTIVAALAHHRLPTEVWRSACQVVRANDALFPGRGMDVPSATYLVGMLAAAGRWEGAAQALAMPAHGPITVTMLAANKLASATHSIGDPAAAAVVRRAVAHNVSAHAAARDVTAAGLAPLVVVLAAVWEVQSLGLDTTALPDAAAQCFDPLRRLVVDQRAYDEAAAAFLREVAFRGRCGYHKGAPDVARWEACLAALSALARAPGGADRMWTTSNVSTAAVNEGLPTGFVIGRLVGGN